MRVLLVIAQIVWRVLSIAMALGLIIWVLLILEPGRLWLLIPYLTAGFIIGIPYAEKHTRDVLNPYGNWVHDPMEYASTLAKFSVVGVPWFIGLIIKEIRSAWQRWRKKRSHPNGDDGRCPGCGAWIGAWRGATWHEENCKFEQTVA